MEKDRFKTLGEKLLAFADARDWRQFHSPKNLSMAMAGEVGELLEHFQWLSESEARELPTHKVEEVALELADIQIYLIRIAQELGVDLLGAVERKIDINEERYPADRVRGSHRKYSEY